VFVMVATADQAAEALFGSEGAAAALEPQSTVAIMSTIGPAAVRDLAARLSASQIGTLDAPVSGGTARADSGELVIMAAGAHKQLEDVRPFLERLGSTVVHVGETVGDGQAVKLVNQLLCGVHIAAAAEALGFAAALGLEPRAVWEVVRKGAAGSFMLDDRGSRMLDGDFDPARSAVDIFVKDMGLVTTAAKREKLPTPLAAAAEQLYLMGAAAGLGRRDDASLVTLYERWATGG
jgi:3-hydroxyisobutyrate dehydrogenase/putative dehydrogenase